MIEQENKKIWLNKYFIIFLVLILVLILLFLGFFCGFVVGIKGYPPRDFLMTIYKRTLKNEIFEEIYPLHLLTDVDALITVRNQEDIDNKRTELIDVIWKGQGFPTSIPNTIEIDITEERFSIFNNLKSVDKMVVIMEYGLDSNIYHLHPIESNGELMIYNQGHGGDFFLGEKTIRFFLDRGYSILALSMPVSGMNNRPVVDFERFGVMRLEDHDFFLFLETDEINPFKFFVEPLARALNALDYNKIYMIGISGGGWSTIVYSALDPRIDKSYPVAGNHPIFVRNFLGKGDYEQTAFDVYNTANYLEMYIMGSYGRRQLQILNRYDPEGFEGIGYQLYEGVVNKISPGFSIFSDTTHREHIISDRALEVIIDDLENY